MQKIIKVDNKAIVFFEDGSCLERKVTDEEFDNIIKATSDAEVIQILCPEYKKKIEERESAIAKVESFKNSKILTMRNDAVYWDNVSSLSLPADFAMAIVDAEEHQDELRLTTYSNFWTLMSLNPDEICRKNLYWFLQLHGLKLAKCGFFVAYRNVEKTSEEGIYTDAHSHSTRIKIGEMVTMDRDSCDCDSNNECSRGLHCASALWLKKNYFGEVGMACLVNPADVVAVPHRSEYGKLRTCAYLPMEIIHYDENDDVIPLNVEDGFDCSYVTKVIYEGIMGTEQDSPYKIIIPDVEGLPVESIQDKLLDIAKQCIVDKVL